MIEKEKPPDIYIIYNFRIKIDDDDDTIIKMS